MTFSSLNVEQLTPSKRIGRAYANFWLFASNNSLLEINLLNLAALTPFPTFWRRTHSRKGSHTNPIPARFFKTQPLSHHCFLFRVEQLTPDEESSESSHAHTTFHFSYRTTHSWNTVALTWLFILFTSKNLLPASNLLNQAACTYATVYFSRRTTHSRKWICWTPLFRKGIFWI